MVVARDGEAAQVAHDEQRVRIDRVGVEQVVLHAPDDAAEGGDVAAEHAVGVHAPQLVRHPDRRAQDLEEQAVMARVLAELLVDQPQVARHRAHGRGAHAANLRVLLQEHEQLEQRRRGAREHLLAHRLERAVAHLEARIERTRRLALGEDRLAEQLQQQLVEQADVHDGAVVALHELLDRERVGGILVAEDLREADLVIEQQAILAPPGEDVQAEAHLPQEGLRLLAGGAAPPRRQKAVRDEPVERVGAEVALGDPGDGLDVAQPAGAGLDVGLEVVGGVVRLEVPLGLLAHLGLEELLHRPDALRARARCASPPSSAALPASRRASSSVVMTLTSPTLSSAHSATVRTLWPDLEADVPQEA